MKNDLIHLQLQCSKSWSDMKPTESGGFCSTCSTEVIDFSGCSSTEINNYLERHSDKKICGKFRKEQLHPQSSALYQPLAQFSLRSLVLGAALSSFLSFDLLAENDHAVGSGGFPPYDPKIGENVVLGNLPGGAPHALHEAGIFITEKDGVTPIPVAKLTLFGPGGMELSTFYTSLTGIAELPGLGSDEIYSVKIEREGYVTQKIFVSNSIRFELTKVKLTKKIK